MGIQCRWVGLLCWCIGMSKLHASLLYRGDRYYIHRSVRGCSGSDIRLWVQAHLLCGLNTFRLFHILILSHSYLSDL